MDLPSFINSQEDFSRLSSSDKIRRFAWYLSEVKHVKIDASGITLCFREAKYPIPDSVGTLVRALARGTRPFLLPDRGGFVLSRFAHQQLDSRLGEREATVEVHELLSTLPQRVSNLQERTYLEESLRCFRAKAFRAAVVMAWNLAYDHLCEFIWRSHLSPFNTQLPLTFPKAEIKMITRRDDFMELKESQVIQVARSATIINDNVRKILKEKLDRRNIAAHPSGVEISQLTAEDCIRDLVVNVVLKL